MNDFTQQAGTFGLISSLHTDNIVLNVVIAMFVPVGINKCLHLPVKQSELKKDGIHPLETYYSRLKQTFEL